MKNKNTEKEMEEELVKSVLKDFEIRQLERKSFESTWQLNINFFLSSGGWVVQDHGVSRFGVW